MSKKTKQIDKWCGCFGKEYTERNILSVDESNALYAELYGISIEELNGLFLSDLSRNITILEVGANVGNQLLVLQGMGFRNLYGIEINPYAVERAKSHTKDINIIQGNIFDIPFKDRFFDLVFTCGVLIHIAPEDITKALLEIYRCSKKYIWGLEYYADKYTEINYRGHDNLLWKSDFAGLYLDLFDDLELVKEKKLKYVENENVDTMFLIRKRNH